MTCHPFFEHQEFEQKQAVPTVPTVYQLGGTLVAGPGCPVTCGDFVECAYDRRSKQNLLDFQWLGNTAQVIRGASQGVSAMGGAGFDQTIRSMEI